MITTVDEYDFLQAFKSVRPDNFTRAGLLALYDYLEQLEDELQEPMHLDVIAFCCEYSEYESLKEFKENYGEDYKSLEDIENSTTVIKIDDSRFIIRDF